MKQYTTAEKAEYYARKAEEERMSGVSPKKKNHKKTSVKGFTWEHLALAFLGGLIIAVLFL